MKLRNVLIIGDKEVAEMVAALWKALGITSSVCKDMYEPFRKATEMMTRYVKDVDREGVLMKVVQVMPPNAHHTHVEKELPTVLYGAKTWDDIQFVKGLGYVIVVVGDKPEDLDVYDDDLDFWEIKSGPINDSALLILNFLVSGAPAPPPRES